MNKRLAVPAFVFLLPLFLLTPGCSSDSTAPGGGGGSTSAFNGVWSVEGEVVAKRACIYEVGDTLQWDVLIAADGARGVISLAGPPRELVIDGTTATASWAEDGGQIILELTLSGGVLGGTVTASNDGGACTDVFALTGARSNPPLAAGFDGSWDLTTEVVTSQCPDETAGTIEEICRRIVVDDNRLTIDDADGTIVGYGIDSRAVFYSVSGGEVLSGELFVLNDELSGEFDILNTADNCAIVLDINGSRRQEACPPPPAPNEFEGGWYVEVVQFDLLGCFSPGAGGYIGECIDVMVDGANISLDDGMGLGLLTGTIEETGAVLTRQDADGLYTMTLEIVDGQIMGESAKTFTSGNCSGSDFWIRFETVSLPGSCADAGGAFAGDWNLALTWDSDLCELAVQNICSSFFQNGTVVIDAENGWNGEVTGSTLQIHDVETILEFDQVWTVDLSLSPDGPLYGTFTVEIRSISNPQNFCTSVATVVGTPAQTPCSQSKAAGRATGPAWLR